MKDLLRKVNKVMAIGKHGRQLRMRGYQILDFAGGRLFSLLRQCGILHEYGDVDRRAVKKILIIRTDRIGDLMLSIPGIRSVRRTFPRAEIHLLIAEYTKELVMDNPDIDRLLIEGKDLLETDYDLALAFHPGMVPNRLAFQSGAKWRTGYTGWGGGFYLTHKIKDDRSTRIRHEVESVLEIAGAVGCKPVDTTLDVSVTEAGEQFAEMFFRNNRLRGRKVVILHPGARQEHIRWRKEGFAEVGDKLIAHGMKVVLIGGRGERRLVQETASLMKCNPVQALNMDLTQLVSLVRKSDLFIGNSTGTMHIAAATGTPVVAVFGNVHPLDSYEEWGPWGRKHVVVSKDMDCPDCHPSDCETFKCMKLISAQDVFEAAKERLNMHMKHGIPEGQLV